MGGGAWWATVHGVAKSQTRRHDFVLSWVGLQGWVLGALKSVKGRTEFTNELIIMKYCTLRALLWTGKPGRLQSLGSHSVGHG